MPVRSSCLRRGIGRGLAVAAMAAAAGAFAADDATDLETGKHLADILRAGRSVISANQSLINDPALADKGFTGDVVLAGVDETHEARVGAPPITPELSDRDRRLIEAQMQAMARIVDQHQAEINREGVGFKGFIPAVFARLTNEEFGNLAGDEARVRVTAPMELVRNRKARPDAWEREVIETRLSSADWPNGEPYAEVVDYEGRPAFRMLIPEYYNDSCLSCHGGPKGEQDVTGYPKEGGAAGDLAGAISIVLFR